MPAEIALGDQPVGSAVEQRAPLLELVDARRRLLRVQLGHAPVVEHLAAAHRVAEVDLPVVLGIHVAHGGSRTALGHHGVRLAQERLADQSDVGAGVVSGDCGPQPGAARADDKNVVGMPLDAARISHDAYSIIRRTGPIS